MDLIERQAAIDAIYHHLTGWTMDECRMMLHEVPSAQPFNQGQPRIQSSDCISRQAAIEAFHEMASDIDYLCNVGDYVKYLESMQSAQPEIIRCCDCKHHWTYRCMDSMPMEKCDLEQTFYDANVDYCSLAERKSDG